MQKNKQIIFLIVIFLCIILDQLSKFSIDKFLLYNQKILVLPNILSIEKVYNSGAAFSLFQNNTLLLIIISLLTSLFIIAFVFKKNTVLGNAELIGLALITGGAIGNLLDRLIYSHVIDFIQTEFIRFPVFNFADVFINIGVIILIVSMFVYKNDR